MLATQEAHVIPPIWIKHLEMGLLTAQRHSPLRSPSQLTRPEITTRRTDGAGGDGLFTNEFVSVNMTGLKGPDIVSVEMTI